MGWNTYCQSQHFPKHHVFQRHRVASEMLQLRKPGALGGARREAESRLDDWGTLILSGNLCMDHMASENVGFIYMDGI